MGLVDRLTSQNSYDLLPQFGFDWICSNRAGSFRSRDGHE